MKIINAKLKAKIGKYYNFCINTIKLQKHFTTIQSSHYNNISDR